MGLKTLIWDKIKENKKEKEYFNSIYKEAYEKERTEVLKKRALAKASKDARR